MRRIVLQVSGSMCFGGAEGVILQLLEGLDPEQWRCVLLHPCLNGRPTPLLDGARALDVEHHTVGFPVGSLPTWQIASLARQLRTLRAAVLHVHLTSPLDCRFVLLAAALAGIPVVATVHLIPEDWPSRLKPWNRIALSTVSRYIAVSERTAARLRDELAIPPSKIRLVRNAVRIDRFSSAVAGSLRRDFTAGSRLRVVVVVARLARHKGHEYLLRAAAQLPEVAFLLAGEGSEREALQRQARELGLPEHRVRFLGYRADIPRLLASADALVLPSLYEGLPLAVLEAMAAGKPVVATAIGGVDEAVVHGKTGLLVPPGDPDALAAAIRSIVGDSRLARRLGACGRARVSAHFRVENMVKRVADVYDELLA